MLFYDIIFYYILMCFIGILIVEKNRYILIKIFNYVLNER